MKSKSLPKKYLGQHFLHAPGTLDKLVQFIAPMPQDHLVEIGPGLGALTTRLLPLVDSMDVIEVDHDVIGDLQHNCQNLGQLHIHEQDVLQFDFAQFTAPIRLVGNLPYNISTPLIFHVIKNTNIINDMHFMLQKEVAERMAAKPGSKIYGRLSVMVQYYCQIELLLDIKPGAFFPPPKVDSTFLRLIPYQQKPYVACDERKFGEVVRLAFSQRRKTISNSLRSVISASELEQLGVNPKARAEELGVDVFVRICNEFALNLRAC